MKREYFIKKLGKSSLINKSVIQDKLIIISPIIMKLSDDGQYLIYEQDVKGKTATLLFTTFSEITAYKALDKYLRQKHRKEYS